MLCKNSSSVTFYIVRILILCVSILIQLYIEFVAILDFAFFSNSLSREKRRMKIWNAKYSNDLQIDFQSFRNIFFDKDILNFLQK